MDNNTTISIKSRLDWIDGLKGICALIVVIDHVFASMYGAGVNHSSKTPLLHILWDGNFAVSIFIILSTILVCHGFNRHRLFILEHYSQLVLKRYFRIAIPTWVVMIIMFFANLFGLYADGVNAPPITFGSIKHLPGYLLFAPLGGGFDILFVTWMLKYVFLGTMWTVILDILLYKLRTISKLVLLTLCLYIAAKTDFYYINVIAGYTIYNEIIHSVRKRNRTFNMSIVLLLIIMFLISDFYYYSPEWNMFRAVIVVTAIAISSKLQSLLEIKWLTWLGIISMNIYLLHMLVIYVITYRLLTYLDLNIMNNIVIYGLTLFAVILLSYIFYKFIEPYIGRVIDKVVTNLYTCPRDIYNEEPKRYIR